jgi:hypothetical protein
MTDRRAPHATKPSSSGPSASRRPEQATGTRLPRRLPDLDQAGSHSEENAILELQRLVGNQATSRLLERRADRGLPPDGGSSPQQASGTQHVIQRGLLSWLKKKFARKPKKGPEPSGGEVESEQQTKTDDKLETIEAKETPPTVPEHPPEGKSPLTLAGGQKILGDAFGKTKEFVPGKIEILDTAGFKTAYDAIYGRGQWSWDLYVVPTYGGLNGFAHDGTNYINKDSAGLHTVVHEMLHNNVAPDWRDVVGSRWDEGTTEILTQVACAKANEPAPVCYPGESPVVQEALDQGLPLADLEDAYLSGGAQAKIADWADKSCKENWAAIKGYMEAKNWSAAKAALAKKTG